MECMSKVPSHRNAKTMANYGSHRHTCTWPGSHANVFLVLTNLLQVGVATMDVLVGISFRDGMTLRIGNGIAKVDTAPSNYNLGTQLAILLHNEGS